MLSFSLLSFFLYLRAFTKWLFSKNYENAHRKKKSNTSNWTGSCALNSQLIIFRMTLHELCCATGLLKPSDFNTFTHVCFIKSAYSRKHYVHFICLFIIIFISLNVKWSIPETPVRVSPCRSPLAWGNIEPLVCSSP